MAGDHGEAGATEGGDERGGHAIVGIPDVDHLDVRRSLRRPTQLLGQTAVGGVVHAAHHIVTLPYVDHAVSLQLASCKTGFISRRGCRRMSKVIRVTDEACGIP